jgi:2,6-dihydroxypyridine 3-monooxygenase
MDAKPGFPTVIIMGGSLGGLSAGLFLRAIGCSVTILERSPAPLSGLGAGIVLNPATIRYFTQQDFPALPTISVASQWLRYLDQQGAMVAEASYAYRFSAYNTLYHALLQAFGTEHYHLATAVERFSQDEAGVTVYCHGGAKLRCDLLVCADGIRSTARRQLLPTVDLAYAGYVAWRGLVRTQDLPPTVTERLTNAITYYLMPQSHLLTYPIPGNEGNAQGALPLLNWLWYRNVAAGSALQQIMTDRTGVVRDVSLPPGAVRAENAAQLRLDAAAALPLQLVNLINQTDQPFVQAVMDCAVPQMAFGRVCLIGDAAFVARPHAAAGTAKAVEDGWQLSLALQNANGDVAEALGAWEAGQLALGSAVLERTRAAGQRVQVEDRWQVGDPLPFGLYEVGDSQMG